MNNQRRFFLLLILAVFLGGCATPETRRVSVSDSATKEEAARQMDIAVQEMGQEQERLTRVYRELAVRAVDFCGDHVGPSLGWYLMSRPKGDIGEAYGRVYGVTEHPTVVFVLAGGSAESAGLKQRDVILGVNGQSTADKAAMTKLSDELPAENAIELSVERTGQQLSITVHPERTCRYSAQLDPQQIINAFADGKRIMVARGMMNFAKDDNELALVVSHELAHNIMGHIDAKKKNMGVGLLADLAAAILSRGQVHNTNFAGIGAGAYSQDFEAEADYVGLYIMKKAGLPIEDAPKFWRRMAAMAPGSIKTNYSASHPSTAYRMLALEETVKEIDGKASKGEPLVPTMKDGKFTLSTK